MKAEEQFVIDARGKKVAVMVDLKTYERLRDAEEELSDIRAFDLALPKAQNDLRAGNTISLSEYKRRRSSKRR